MIDVQNMAIAVEANGEQSVIPNMYISVYCQSMDRKDREKEHEQQSKDQLSKRWRTGLV